MYKHFFKRLIDFVLALCGIVVLAIPMIIIAIVVKCDSKGPVFFMQKRVGLHKKTFMMPKFRSMYTETPAELPTHMLNDPARWITKSGAVLRKTSLDELPQLFSSLKGDMAVIGPRPALWNQDDLIAEREKYGANDIRPGLTGWAQINGRDELEIADKAALDGEYAQCLASGGFKAFAMDCRCFLGTIASVLKHEGVVEGGTGAVKEKENS
jgi:O-antigen biosynthesis protein WbqP